MKDIFEKLDRVYQFARNNEYSNFYRLLYGPNSPVRIATLEDWQQLPLLSKKDIAATPFLDRIFSPYADIGTIRLTSGTSGSMPLTYPRSVSAAFENYFDDLHSTNCVLTFFAPQHLLQGTCKEAGSKHLVIAGDPGDLEGSVEFALAAGLDNIMCIPSILEAMIPILQDKKACHNIKSIELAGETLSKTAINRLHTIFPNAYLRSDYALTESQGAVGVGPIDLEQGAIYQPTTTTYWEIIGEDNELVISHTWIEQNHFPLLRYRTGDRVEALSFRGQNYYRILGRLDLDRIKLYGGELRADMVERAVRDLHPALDGDYELHLTYTKSKERVLPAVEIRLTTRGNIENIADIVAELAPLVASRIYVAPNYTYADGIRDGHYATLKCSVIPAKISSTTKKKRFYINN